MTAKVGSWASFSSSIFADSVLLVIHCRGVGAAMVVARDLLVSLKADCRSLEKNMQVMR